MEKEIITNEEIMETVEDVIVPAAKKSNVVLKVCGVTALATAGLLLVTKVIVPAIKNRKAKKAAEQSAENLIDVEFESKDNA